MEVMGTMPIDDEDEIDGEDDDVFMFPGLFFPSTMRVMWYGED